MSEDLRTELVARCENRREPDGGTCPGLLAYRWGQSEAACETCGARCGVAVAAWLEVRAIPRRPAAAVSATRTTENEESERRG